MIEKAVLITGANGFIGNAICKRCQNENIKTIAAVRSSNFIFKNNLVFEIGNADIKTDWSTALAGVNCVVHTLARVHVMREKTSDPIKEFRAVNVDATLNLARQASKMGVKRFIFISSVKVNGETNFQGALFSETDVAAPKSPYSVSKWEAEQNLLELAEVTGMEVVILRLPLVYGPGVKANFLNMMHWLNSGLPLPFGAIHNKRSLVGLDNLVDLILTCICHPSAANQTFMVSDGEDLSTTELLRRTAVALGKPARLLPVPQGLLDFCLKMLGKQELAQRLCGPLQVDITKARSILGWSPPLTVDEELHRTAHWYKNYRKK